MKRRVTALSLVLWAGGLAAQPAAAQGGSMAQPRGITAVEGLKVGHFTLTARPTGCTVVLVEGGAVGGVDVSATDQRQVAQALASAGSEDGQALARLMPEE